MSLFDKINLPSRLNFDDLYNIFVGMERRQQMGLMAIAVMVVLGLLFMPVSCVSGKLSELESDYKKAQKLAGEFYKAEAKAKVQESHLSGTAGGSLDSDDPLKQIVYEISDQLQIERQKVNLKTITPVQNGALIELSKDVTLSGMTWEQTVRLLQSLAQDPRGVSINVKKISIQSDPKNKSIMKTVSLMLSVLRPNK